MLEVIERKDNGQKVEIYDNTRFKRRRKKWFTITAYHSKQNYSEKIRLAEAKGIDVAKFIDPDEAFAYAAIFGKTSITPFEVIEVH